MAMKWLKKSAVIFTYPTRTLDAQTFAVVVGCIAVAATRFKNPLLKLIALNLIERLQVRVEGNPEADLQVDFATFADADVTELALCACNVGESLAFNPGATDFLMKLAQSA
jgi:hypothetical protein